MVAVVDRAAVVDSRGISAASSRFGQQYGSARFPSFQGFATLLRRENAVKAAAHFWTLYPHIRHSLVRYRCPPSDPFETRIADSWHGDVTVTGRLHRCDGSRRLVVILHGLGGTMESFTSRRLAAVCARRGVSSLRFSHRGADGSGEDYGHAGLTADLHAVLAAPDVASFDEIYLAGYSWGGIVSLAAACEQLDARVRRLVAVCPPLDLARCQQHVDEDAPSLYRRVLLSDMKSVYRAVAARRRVPLPVAEANRIDRIGEWDDKIVAPRFGFRDVGDYYERTQMRGRLHEVQVPGLILHVRNDPLIPLDSRGELASDPPAKIDARLLDGGGHIYWRGRPGRARMMEETILDWLLD